jgi:hypothetical protein
MGISDGPWFLTAVSEIRTPSQVGQKRTMQQKNHNKCKDSRVIY